MHIHYPSLVLVPDTFISHHSSSDPKASLLIECIEGEFEDVPIEPVKRRCWNETVGGSSEANLKSITDAVHPGLQFITELALDDEERATTLLSASTKYGCSDPPCMRLYSKQKSQILCTFRFMRPV